MTSPTPEPGQPPAIAVAAPPKGWAGELKDAITPRTMALVVGVFLIQLAFITSYIGAFHHPVPHRVPVQVVASSAEARQLATRLNAIPGSPLHVTVATSEAAARQAIEQNRAAAVFLPAANGHDTVLLASASGASQATAVETVFQQVAATEHQTVIFDDLVPFQSGDGRGLSAFYLVIGWLVGGYLFASILGIAAGSRPATFRRARIRLLSAIPYAAISGLGGTVVLGPVLGAVHGHFMAIWAIGTLLVLSAATVTMAFQVLFGTIGIGVTVLVFVVLGNPSAGGAYTTDLLPAFWRTISPAIPNGAGATTLRQVAYFGAHGITTPLLVVSAWIVVGTIVTLIASRDRRLTQAAGRLAAERTDDFLATEAVQPES